LRQNPDVIVVGEIRDGETAIVALQAAETGHLVIGSLHADSVVESISRYLLLGPPERSAEMRYVLARTMRVILNQRLAGMYTPISQEFTYANESMVAVWTHSKDAPQVRGF
jgi:Tfp pilus assembly pilus retraction ATPase PilT